MKPIYFVGIKGSGMSSLAVIISDLGSKVLGSDVDEYFFTQKKLDEKRIPILTFNPMNITGDCIYVIGNAFNEMNNPEVAEIKRNGYDYYTYHDFLGNLIQDYNSIAISGAHGKTSTTGLAAHVFKNMKNTSYLIGDGTGEAIENTELFVFEACEYQRHFLAYRPNFSIITNIDFDHPDYYQGIEDVQAAFEDFIRNTKEKVVIFGDDEHAKELIKAYHEKMLTYGFEKENDLIAKNIRTNEKGTIFQVEYNGNDLGDFFVPMHGLHQVLNALSVIGIAILNKMNLTDVRMHMATYRGVNRRFNEQIVDSNIVIDDYAHHPTEIVATIAAAKAKYPNKECVVVFQPHTYSRTKQFLYDFAKSFDQADRVYLCDIFGSARENQGDVSIYDLINLTKNSNHLRMDNVRILTRHENAVILFMGAGDITRYMDEYKKQVLVR